MFPDQAGETPGRARQNPRGRLRLEGAWRVAFARGLSPTVGQIIPQRMLGAGEGQLGPRETVPRKLFHVHRLVQRRGFAAGDHRGEDGDGRNLALVGIEPNDTGDPYLETRLFEHLALRRRFRPLAALHETAGESPFAVARIDVALYQHDPAVQLEKRSGHQLRAQVEHEAAVLADQSFGIALFDDALLKPSRTAWTKVVLRGSVARFQSLSRLLELR